MVSSLDLFEEFILLEGTKKRNIKTGLVYIVHWYSTFTVSAKIKVQHKLVAIP